MRGFEIIEAHTLRRRGATQVTIREENDKVQQLIMTYIEAGYMPGDAVEEAYAQIGITLSDEDINAIAKEFEGR